MGWKIRIRDGEEDCDQPFLSPDIVITQNAGFGAGFDFALADTAEAQNRGGLRSREALHTGILIQLFTDARARDDDALPDSRDPDRRGWWGDAVDADASKGDRPIGSRLWLLRRAALTGETPAIAVEMVEEALQPFIDQGAVARFDVTASNSVEQLGRTDTGVLGIDIKGYDQDGQRVYAQRFEALWDQIRELAA